MFYSGNDLTGRQESVEDGKAAEKVGHSITSEREVLADLLSSTDSEWLTDYISLRSAESIESLKSYQSPRGSEWREPSC